MKEGRINRAWQRRFFTLHRAPYRMHYFASESKVAGGAAAAKGMIDLTALAGANAVTVSAADTAVIELATTRKAKKGKGAAGSVASAQSCEPTSTSLGSTCFSTYAACNT